MHAQNAPKTHQDCPRCPQTPQRQSQGPYKSRFLMVWEAKNCDCSMIFPIIQLAQPLSILMGTAECAERLNENDTDPDAPGAASDFTTVLTILFSEAR